MLLTKKNKKMKRLFFAAIVLIALLSFSSCSGTKVTHYSCAGINRIPSNQKAVQPNFYKLGVQKKYEIAVKRQQKTYKKALRAGDGTYNY